MTLHLNDPAQSIDEDISLIEIWEALTKRIVTIAVVTFFCGASAAAVALCMKPVYRSEVTLTVVEDGGNSGGLSSLAGQFGGLASLAGLSLGGSSTRSEVLGTLSSRQLAERYINSQNLLPVLFEEKWDNSTGDWKTETTKKPTLWDATQLFTKDVRKISDDKKGGLVTLSVEWTDAKLATQWANDLVSLANETLRQRAIDTSTHNLEYLNKQLEQTTVVELRQSMYRLIEAEIKNVMIARGNTQYAFKIIDPATVPERKTKPKRAAITLTGAFLGFSAACFWVLIRRQRQQSQS